MSKMQMLLFAVGIAVVALLFYNFISQLDLGQQAQNLVLTNSKFVADRMNNDAFCSDKSIVLPDRLYLGLQREPFFYDLEFLQQPAGASITNEGETNWNQLIIRVVKHSNSSDDKKTIVASKSITANANFVLIKPDFLYESTSLEASYNNGQNTFISLFPRAAKKGSVQIVSPNAFVALKEVVGGKTSMYIIPCSTEKERNNCERNILRLGCFLLSKKNPNPNDLVQDCLNVTTQMLADSSISRNYKWSDCITIFGSNLSN